MQLIGLKYMNDRDSSSTTTGGAVSRDSSVSGGSLSGGRPFSTTKRETVMLPNFSGDERTAYLKYPMWKNSGRPILWTTRKSTGLLCY